MNEQRPPHREQIADTDWERTPASVKQFLTEMAKQMTIVSTTVIQSKGSRNVWLIYGGILRRWFASVVAMTLNWDRSLWT